uniref:Alkaline phosphatase D family protein n=1 Tax=Roseihalotalea indica TaxID=2867963 RepID=A0AA49GNC1_9BACT|nr:alkaline phosphatase D family protein [Tunicatimonas sp. TK19036]
MHYTQLFLFISLFGTLFISCTRSAETSESQPLSTLLYDSLEYDLSLKPFYYGVASGDPRADQVVLWTKVVPDSPQPSILVDWEVAEDEEFVTIVQSGTYDTDSTSGHTVKFPVEGLSADTYYYYRFSALAGQSVVGRTKTAPAVGSAEQVKFAVVSCNNYEGGFFTAFANIANRDDLDAVVHLGDYIYEYPQRVYGDSTTGRFHQPNKEVISLEDYRIRYAQYRLDRELMRVHQQHPFISIWDDHEIANNSYQSGAQNHTEDEGDFTERRNAAVQTYFEWMPVRQHPENQLYRTLQFGDVAELMMLDERLAGRDEPATSVDDPAYEDEARDMLGEEQLGWLQERLTNSPATWKVLGNQVIFSDVNTEAAYGNPKNLDAWDGYPASKQRVAGTIQENNVEDVIILSGDTHTSWAFETAINPTETYDAETSEGAFAVEFGTPSISSGNLDEGMPRDTVDQIAEKLQEPAYNPHLKYVNLADHGYLLLTLTPEQAQAEWYFVETIQQPESAEYLAKAYVVEKGQHTLQEMPIEE